jgi:hypothetical protein
MSNNYRRYLTDANWRRAVNALHLVFETFMMDEYYRLGGDEHYSEADAQKVSSDWLEAAIQAEQMVHEGAVLFTDEEAAAHLPEYEEWLKLKSTRVM